MYSVCKFQKTWAMRASHISQNGQKFWRILTIWVLHKGKNAFGLHTRVEKKNIKYRLFLHAPRDLRHFLWSVYLPVLLCLTSISRPLNMIFVEKRLAHYSNSLSLPQKSLETRKILQGKLFGKGLDKWYLLIFPTTTFLHPHFSLKLAAKLPPATFKKVTIWLNLAVLICLLKLFEMIRNMISINQQRILN